MTRGLTSDNQAEITAPSLQVITLVNLQFDTPLYVHSGIGTITYDSNDYLGVGDFGSVDSVEESEEIIAAPIRLVLSGVDSQHVTEALDAGNYGDPVTIYEGYRQDDGTLVDDPWVVAKGTFEFATVGLGDNNDVSITVRNNLARLDEKNGARFSDEDQRSRYSADEGFEHVTNSAVVKLLWGGATVGSGTNERDWNDPRRDR